MKSLNYGTPHLSRHVIVQVEHVLFSTRKSPNFLEWRAVIGQQSVYTSNLRYRIHAVDICSYTPKYAGQLTLQQMHVTKGEPMRSAFYVVSQSQSKTTSKRVRIYRLPFFCRHCHDVRSDVCHGSTISSADFLRKLNHAQKVGQLYRSSEAGFRHVVREFVTSGFKIR